MLVAAWSYPSVAHWCSKHPRLVERWLFEPPLDRLGRSTAALRQLAVRHPAAAWSIGPRNWKVRLQQRQIDFEESVAGWATSDYTVVFLNHVPEGLIATGLQVCDWIDWRPACFPFVLTKGKYAGGAPEA